MPNKWVEHVKAFAAKNNLSYACALSKPECKQSYQKYDPSKTKIMSKEKRKEVDAKAKKLIPKPMKIKVSKKQKDYVESYGKQYGMPDFKIDFKK